MQNVRTSNWMIFDERMAEVSSILAAGIIRSRKRQIKEVQRSRSFSANRLDVFVEKSVHVTNKPLPEEEM